MKPKHIYWFAYFDHSCPSVRYRGKYLLEHLAEEEGIAHDLVIPSYQLAKVLYFLRIYVQVLLFRKKDSVIVFQKLYSRGIYANALKLLLRFRTKATVYDLDDAEYLRHSPKSIHFFLRKCSQVLVGSLELQQYALQFNPKVTILTSPIIPHSCRQTAATAPLKIGWIGFFNNHRMNLETLVFPALERLSFPIQFELLGVNRADQRQALRTHFSAFPHVELLMPEALNWQDETSIYQRISSWHLGLAPLLDNPFNRAKSAFKLKQVKSCGVPVFASPVGENVHFLEEGKDGFFFEDATDLERLLLQHHAQLLRNGFSVCTHLVGFSITEYVNGFLNQIN